MAGEPQPASRPPGFSVVRAAAVCLPRPPLAGVLGWAGLSFALNLVWEVVQLPLYTIAETGTAAQLAYAVLHCTLGDVIIASGSFILAGLLLRAPDWPSSLPWPGMAIAMVCGLLYTAYSEWNNVYVAGTWAYTAGMPRVFGIGLAPLLQWVAVPALSLAIIRFRLRRIRRRPVDG